MCAASTRIIVEETIYDRVVDGLAGAVSRNTLGYWRDGDFTKGPLISEHQLNKVLDYVESGK